MAKPSSRQSELSRIHYVPAQPGGPRAVFLVEARTRKQVRQVRELFDMVGQLAEVVTLSDGTLMSYAVQVTDDASLFGKIEWLLKTQFTFSLVERNFSEVTLQLVRSLCEETNSQMAELPECGICASSDPFPTRATVELKDDEELLHLAYCARCSARYAEEDADAAIRGLVARDRRRLRVPREVPVTLLPEIASDRPEWESTQLAVAG